MEYRKLSTRDFVMNPYMACCVTMECHFLIESNTFLLHLTTCVYHQRIMPSEKEFSEVKNMIVDSIYVMLLE